MFVQRTAFSSPLLFSIGCDFSVCFTDLLWHCVLVGYLIHAEIIDLNFLAWQTYFVCSYIDYQSVGLTQEIHSCLFLWSAQRPDLLECHMRERLSLSLWRHFIFVFTLYMLLVGLIYGLFSSNHKTCCRSLFRSDRCWATNQNDIKPFVSNRSIASNIQTSTAIMSLLYVVKRCVTWRQVCWSYLATLSSTSDWINHIDWSSIRTYILSISLPITHSSLKMGLNFLWPLINISDIPMHVPQ